MSPVQTKHFHVYIVYISLRYETYNQMVSQLWSGLFLHCYLIFQHIYYSIILASVLDATVSFLSSSFLSTSEGRYEHLSILHIFVFILRYQINDTSLSIVIHFSSVSIVVTRLVSEAGRLLTDGLCVRLQHELFFSLH